MANVKRKERRVREAFERAKIAERLEQQVEELTKLLEERNSAIHDLRNKLMGAQLQHDKDGEELETLRGMLNTARETLALAKKEHADELLRYQTALTERGELIDELERKRKLARAARDVAARKLAELETKDRDSAKLRRRLHEAKETIKELQTEICRLKKATDERV